MASTKVLDEADLNELNLGKVISHHLKNQSNLIDKTMILEGISSHMLPLDWSKQDIIPLKLGH